MDEQHTAQVTLDTSSCDSPSSRLRLWSCRSTPGSLRGDALETPSICRPLDDRWRTDRHSHGGVSLQGDVRVGRS